VTSSRAAYDLIAPSRCVLLDAAGRADVVARLGPDPLRADGDGAEAVRRLRGARGGVAEALMDQTLVAGVGNVYRAEVLYLHRLDPRTRARDVDPGTYAAVWETLRDVMARGVRVGHILTADVPDDTPPEEGRYVYKRSTCLGCGAPVRAWDVASRTVYACEREQLGAG
jgi:endonuclease-8